MPRMDRRQRLGGACRNIVGGQRLLGRYLQTPRHQRQSAARDTRFTSNSVTAGAFAPYFTRHAPRRMPTFGKDIWQRCDLGGRTAGFRASTGHSENSMTKVPRTLVTAACATRIGALFGCGGRGSSFGPRRGRRPAGRHWQLCRPTSARRRMPPTCSPPCCRGRPVLSHGAAARVPTASSFLLRPFNRRSAHTLTGALRRAPPVVAPRPTFSALIF